MKFSLLLTGTLLLAFVLGLVVGRHGLEGEGGKRKEDDSSARQERSLGASASRGAPRIPSTATIAERAHSPRGFLELLRTLPSERFPSLVDHLSRLSGSNNEFAVRVAHIEEIRAFRRSEIAFVLLVSRRANAQRDFKRAKECIRHLVALKQVATAK